MTGDRIYRIQETGYREPGTARKRRTCTILEGPMERIARAYKRNGRAEEQDRQNRYYRRPRQAYRRNGRARDRIRKAIYKRFPGQGIQ